MVEEETLDSGPGLRSTSSYSLTKTVLGQLRSLGKKLQQHSGSKTLRVTLKKGRKNSLILPVLSHSRPAPLNTKRKQSSQKEVPCLEGDSMVSDQHFQLFRGTKGVTPLISPHQETGKVGTYRASRKEEKQGDTNSSVKSHRNLFCKVFQHFLPLRKPTSGTIIVDPLQIPLVVTQQIFEFLDESLPPCLPNPSRSPGPAPTNSPGLCGFVSARHQRGSMKLTPLHLALRARPSNHELEIPDPILITGLHCCLYACG